MGNRSYRDEKLARTFNFLPSAGEYFCSLYPRRDRFICKLPEQDSWRTWTGPLADYQIMGVIADGGRGLLRGCHWGDETRFAVLDIDAGSNYHNTAELHELAAALGAVGLRLSLYRSSNSGGWHGYIPFTKWEKVNEVEDTLKRWLKSLGYELRGGQLEIFPSGNALRLPLQPGFAWLDLDGNIVQRREDLGLDEALREFLSDLETNAQNWQRAKDLVESQIAICVQASPAAAGGSAHEHEERVDISGFEQLFGRGRIKHIWEKGRKFWGEGLEKPGQRHEAILAVGHYLWYGDEEKDVAALPGGRNDEYRAALIEQWLKEKHNGFCNHISRGDWSRVEEDICRAVGWRKRAEKEREPYPLTPRLLKRLVGIYKKTGRIWSIPQFEKANQDRKIDARERIAEAIKELKEEGQLITAAEVARRAKAHWKTVKKNWDLMALVLCPTLEEKQLLETETKLDLLARSACVTSPGGPLPSPGGLSSCSDVLVQFGFDAVLEKKEKELLESFRELEIQLAAPASQEATPPTPPPLRLPVEPNLELLGLELVQEASSVALAPLVVTPPLLSCLAKEPTTELPVSTGLRSLNGSLPSCAGSPPFTAQPSLTLGPWFGGFQAVLQESAGGLGPSGKLQRDSGVNSPWEQSFGTFRYGKIVLSAVGVAGNALAVSCLQIRARAYHIAVTARIPSQAVSCGVCKADTPRLLARVLTRNQGTGGLFTLCRYGDARGPPK